MKISEVEQRTGMDRTNIRFYENEGLIRPKREDNGYRDFSEGDVESLLRVKLLRSVHVPVDKIKTLLAGKISLSNLLDEQIHVLENEKEDVNYAQEICRLMKSEKISVSELDAKKYLDRLEEKTLQTKTEYFAVTKDKLPQVYRPWKRYFARIMDLAIYTLVLDSFLIVLLNVITSNRSLLESIMFSAVVGVMMLLIEPLLLSKIGTTPGKAVFGLEVRAPEGNKLSYEEGFRRSFGVIKYGLGFSIPFYNLVRLYKSYKILENHETLPWDEEIAYRLKNENSYGDGLAVISMIMLIVAAVFLQDLEKLPPNKGELTIGEFVENYRHYGDLIGLEDDYELNHYGEWTSTRNDRDVFVDIGHFEKPLFRYELSNGSIKSVSFTVNTKQKKMPIGSNRLEILLIYYALAGAQDETTVFSQPIREFTLGKLNNGFTSFKESHRGVNMNVEVSYEGYEEVGEMLFPEDEAELHTYSLYFSADLDRERVEKP